MLPRNQGQPDRSTTLQINLLSLPIHPPHPTQHTRVQDAGAPVRWLSDLFDKYLPPTILEMKRSFSHITPLSTMNFVTVRANIGVCACVLQVLSSTTKNSTAAALLPAGSNPGCVVSTSQA